MPVIGFLAPVLIGSFAASAAVAAGFVVAGGIGAALISGITGMLVTAVIGGTQGRQDSGAQAITAAQQDFERGRLLNTSSTVEPISVIYGTRRVGGSRIFLETTGAKNEFLHVVIAHCEGTVSELGQIYVNDVKLQNAPSVNYIQYWDHLGEATQIADANLIAAVPAKWTDNHKLSGVAYTYFKLTYNAENLGSLPTFTRDINGCLCYDPRDQITRFTRNPALCIADYLTNKTYGRGIPTTAIDWDAIIAASNYCDQLVTTPNGPQSRYTCDGVLDTSSSSLDNTRLLLASCRGMLVYTNGKHRLLIDKPEVATFVFNEDNIVGAWSIKTSEKRNRFNRVKATFSDPTRDWQPNLAIADSPIMRASDNGLMLENTFSLSFTSDLYRARQIAGIELKQSRFGTVVQFTATIIGLRAEAGDVVHLTHSTPGWVNKPMRITRIAILNSDELEITCREYDASVYNLDDLDTMRVTPATNLPNPFSIPAPGIPTITSELYQTTGSAGVKVKVNISFEASPSVFASGYVADYRKLGAIDWVSIRTSSTTAIIFDVDKGIYQFRVKALNEALGTGSIYTSIVQKEIIDIADPPVGITSFSIIKQGGQAIGNWDLHPDLDVRIGGQLTIRHSPLSIGATWADSYVLEDEAGSAVVSGQLPLLTGTYMIKARDSSGVWSLGFASFVATEGLVTGFTTVATSVQHPIFQGAKTNTAVIASELQLDAGVLFDTLPAIDSLATIDAAGGLASLGYYNFDSPIDCLTVSTRRVETVLQVRSFQTINLIDSRLLNFDEWDSFDGAIINDTDLTIYAATTNDNPASAPAVWSAYAPFFVADFTFRGIKFMAKLNNAGTPNNIAVSILRVNIKMPV